MAQGRRERGIGAFTVEQQAEVIDTLKSGLSQKQVAEHFGVSKNVVAGIWARFGDPGARREPTTLGQRLDALHTKMDRVLAETLGRRAHPRTRTGEEVRRPWGPPLSMARCSRDSVEAARGGSKREWDT